MWHVVLNMFLAIDKCRFDEMFVPGSSGLLAGKFEVPGWLGTCYKWLVHCSVVWEEIQHRFPESEHSLAAAVLSSRVMSFYLNCRLISRFFFFFFCFLFFVFFCCFFSRFLTFSQLICKSNQGEYLWLRAAIWFHLGQNQCIQDQTPQNMSVWMSHESTKNCQPFSLSFLVVEWSIGCIWPHSETRIISLCSYHSTFFTLKLWSLHMDRVKRIWYL